MRNRLKISCCILIAGALLILSSFNSHSPKACDQVKQLYRDHLDTLASRLGRFDTDAAAGDVPALRTDFAQCRDAYKYTEYIIEYYYPAIAVKMNGPALPESEPGDWAEVVMPSGFQVLEADIFNEEAAQRILYIRKEIKKLVYLVQHLEQQSGSLELHEPGLLDALRMNLYRLASKGIAGFDAPVTLRSLEEAIITLRAAGEAIGALGISNGTLEKAGETGVRMLQQSAGDFNGFDRAQFLTACFNPLLKALHDAQVKRHIPFLKADRAVRTDAVSFFSPGAFDALFFAPGGSHKASKALTDLGAALFRETALSTGGRSCASCHLPGKAYSDGLVTNRSLQRDEQLSRNTPTLINAALQPSLFWDGRVQFLEEQAHDVLLNKAEMAGSLEQMVLWLKSKPTYYNAFRNAFGKNPDPVTAGHITTALAAYVRSLVQLNTAFDRYMRGETTAMNQQQIRGFNLFMGKAKCATCHYMPLFNGVAPPDYTTADGEVIGVPGNTDTLHPVADKDRGIYLLHGVRHMDGAFKTPGLRSIAKTAPYMHNGVYKTLEEVIDFYDRGGGSGLGLNIPNQTLPTERLELTQQEKKALIAFLKCI